MPGFPAVLAVSFLTFGESRIAARLVLATVGAIGCYLVFVLGRRLFDERTALIASAITAVTPTFIAFSPLFLSETVFAVTLIASLIPAASLLTGLADPKTPSSDLLCQAGTCGALIGLACYMRPSWLLWARSSLPCVRSSPAAQVNDLGDRRHHRRNNVSDTPPVGDS